MLKSVAELEGLDNEMTRKDYELAYQLKQYKEGRLDKAQELRFEDKWRKEDNDTRILAQRIASGATLEAARINADASTQASRNYKTSQAFNMLGAVRTRAEEAVAAELGPVQSELMKVKNPAAYKALVAQEENSMINAIAGDDAGLAEQLRRIQGIGGGEASGLLKPPPPLPENYVLD